MIIRFLKFSLPWLRSQSVSSSPGLKPSVGSLERRMLCRFMKRPSFLRNRSSSFPMASLPGLNTLMSTLSSSLSSRSLCYKHRHKALLLYNLPWCPCQVWRQRCLQYSQAFLVWAFATNTDTFSNKALLYKLQQSTTASLPGWKTQTSTLSCSLSSLSLWSKYWQQWLFYKLQQSTTLIVRFEDTNVYNIL